MYAYMYICIGPTYWLYNFHGYPCKNDHQTNYNCFNEPFAVSPYKSLY